MYKATQSAQQFFAREAMHSTKGSRRGFDLLNHGENPADFLTPEQRRANLVARSQAVQVELLKWPKKSPERIELGHQLQFINNEIHSMRAKRQGSTEVRDYFIEVARRDLPRATYMRIMAEASQLARSALAKAAGPQP